MIKLLPILLIISVLVISGCSQQSSQPPVPTTPTTTATQSAIPQQTIESESIIKYTGTDFKSIGYPSTWKPKQIQNGVLFSGPEESGFVVLFSVIKLSERPSGTLEDFALQQTGTDVTITSKKPGKVNGLDSYEIVSTFLDKGLIIKTKDVFVDTQQGIIYELIFTVPNSSYEKYIQLFEDSIEMFELNPALSKSTLGATELSSTSSKSECSGFSYFSIKNHKLTGSTLMLDIQNEPNDITIAGIDLGGNELKTSLIPISANERAVVTATGSIQLTVGSEYISRLTITYNLGSSLDKHEDVGTCTGVVQ
ncbi:MAG: hypothetical protein HY512_01690 [Candidatus Aenigmarchaeota archaeon]|nr:hypothetical protein [Candidatus Aenigmarchaeota archaeon]